jgi:hypothetical protein
LAGLWAVLSFWHGKMSLYKGGVVLTSGMIAQGKELASNRQIFGCMGVKFDGW